MSNPPLPKPSAPPKQIGVKPLTQIAPPSTTPSAPKPQSTPSVSPSSVMQKAMGQAPTGPTPASAVTRPAQTPTATLAPAPTPIPARPLQSVQQLPTKPAGAPTVAAKSPTPASTATPVGVPPQKVSPQPVPTVPLQTATAKPVATTPITTTPLPVKANTAPVQATSAPRPPVAATPVKPLASAVPAAQPVYKPAINPASAPKAAQVPTTSAAPAPVARPPVATSPAAQTAAQQALQKLKSTGPVPTSPLPTAAAPASKPGSGLPPVGPAATVPATPLPPVSKEPQASAPVFAQSTSPLRKYGPVAAGIFAVVAIVAAGAYWFMGGSNTTTNAPSQNATTSAQAQRSAVPGTKTRVVYWSLWEPEEALQEVITEFEEANPTIDVVFQRQSHKDYRERLQTSIAQGSGPDVFRYHGSWVPMLKNDLSPVPSTVMTPQEFSNTYYPVASEQLQANSQLVGIPIMYDGLVMYYNKDILATAGETPPKTWTELRTVAKKLTIVNEQGKIERGGVALGTSGNVEHFSDILGLLILQNGGSLSNPGSQQVKDALRFYANFATADQVWNDSLPSSTVAFARSEVVFMFAPSWRAHEIKALNPELSFGVASLPQVGANKVTWASYWAEGVNARSQSRDAAWKFVSYLNTDAVLKKMHAAQSQQRGFGEIYAKKSLASELSSVEVAAVVLEDAPTAKGGFMSSYTHDKGLNDKIIKYYADAVNALVQNKSIEEVSTTLNTGVSTELRQYGLSNPAGSAPAGAGAAPASQPAR